MTDDLSWLWRSLQVIGCGVIVSFLNFISHTITFTNTYFAGGDCVDSGGLGFQSWVNAAFDMDLAR